MQIEVAKVAGDWEFVIRAKNKAVLARSERSYVSQRNAIAGAKLIAGSKLKVVVKE